MRKARALLTAVLAASGLLLGPAGWRPAHGPVHPPKVGVEELIENTKVGDPCRSRHVLLLHSVRRHVV